MTILYTYKNARSEEDYVKYVPERNEANRKAKQIKEVFLEGVEYFEEPLQTKH